MLPPIVSLSAAFLLGQRAMAHTSLLTPASREGGKETMADETNTVGCGKPGPGPVTEVNAGAEIPVQYYRNNHIGGFIRWSIIKKGEAETRENFDTNVFYYTCRESGPDCKPRNGKPYSLYKDANDGVDNFQIVCGDKIRIPEYLGDGDYVLQFTNFATGHNFGDAGLAIPTYRSCADLRVTGGSRSKPWPKCPTFVGGDRATLNEKKPNDQCVYFHSNEIPSVVFHEKDPAKVEGTYKFGRPKEIEDCEGGGEGGSQRMPINESLHSFDELQG